MATTCGHCQHALFDYVYGLLEDQELQQVREHLNSCPGCQSALDKVQAQQNLLARAARAITEVPEFALAQEPAAVPQTCTAEPAHAASKSPGGRSWWRRPWVAWATAA